MMKFLLAKKAAAEAAEANGQASKVTGSTPIAERLVVSVQKSGTDVKNAGRINHL